MKNRLYAYIKPILLCVGFLFFFILLFSLTSILGVPAAYASYDDGIDCPSCGKYRWDDYLVCEDCYYKEIQRWKEALYV